MKIPQLFLKLSAIPYIEVVVALLPEVIFLADHAAGDALLQTLHGIRQRRALRLTQQQVDVFRHHNISEDAKGKLAPHTLQSFLKNLRRSCLRKQRTAAMTGECEEVCLSGFVKALKAPRHGWKSNPVWRTTQESIVNYPTQAKRRLEWGTRLTVIY